MSTTMKAEQYTLASKYKAEKCYFRSNNISHKGQILRKSIPLESNYYIFEVTSEKESWNGLERLIRRLQNNKCTI